MARLHAVTNWVLSVVLLIAVGLDGYKSYKHSVQDSKPPTMLLVGTSMWRLYESNLLLADTGLIGLTDCPNKIIIYKKSKYQPTQVTIMHELLHAGACKDGQDIPDNHHWNSDNDKEHAGIYRISEFEATLLHDNPQFAEWLKRKDK